MEKNQHLICLLAENGEISSKKINRRNAIKPASAKQKGRLMQQWVRDKILYWNPELRPDDVRSTSMGSGGEDIQLSTKAREMFPYQMA